MRLNSIHHIAIICSDKEKALHFYRDLLGFELVRMNQRSSDWKIDMKINDDTELEIFIKPNAPGRLSYPEAKGLRHLAFKIDSVDEAVTELKQRGIICEPVRIDNFTDRKMTFFTDPDGLPIEIHE